MNRIDYLVPLLLVATSCDVSETQTKPIEVGQVIVVDRQNETECTYQYFDDAPYVKKCRKVRF